MMDLLTESQAVELLIRIDERTKKIEENLALFEELYVTHKEFAPVKLITYGLVTLCMTGLIGALLMLILRKPF